MLCFWNDSPRGVIMVHRSKLKLKSSYSIRGDVHIESDEVETINRISLSMFSPTLLFSNEILVGNLN
jgi:hypothetical protein